MTRKEFAQIAVVLDQCWPGDFGETAEAAYFALLQDIDLQSCEAALRKLRGQRFRPSVPEIVQAAGNTDRARFLELQRSICAQRYGIKKANELFEQLEPLKELSA